MKNYRTFKTTMGRKFRVRMTAEEMAEKELYNLVIVVLPFVGTIALMLTWLWR